MQCVKFPYHYAVAAMLLVAGCTKFIDFEGDNAVSRIVLNGVFQPDSLITLKMSNSVGYIEDADNVALVQGNVALFDDQGNLIDSLQHQGNGTYRSTVVAQPGMQYTVAAEHAGFTSVWATDRVPATVPILTVDTLRVPSNDPFDNTVHLEVSISFTDPPGVANFYRIEVFSAQLYFIDWVYDEQLNELVSDTIWLNSPERWLQSISTSDQVILADNALLAGESALFDLSFYFTDRLFDGQTRTVKFRIESFSESGQYEIALTSLSFDYYRFNRSLIAYRETFGDPFAQPVQVFTNVNEGLGIVGGRNPYLYQLN
jgi:hypothetical protein